MPPGAKSTQRFFTKHAAGYAKSTGFAKGADLQALLKALHPGKTEVALDVATGTGFTALSLAPLVRNVIGVDITEEMLRQARTLARKRKIENVKFEQGDASKLGYPDSSFNIVATRRATHHFADIPSFLLEAKRLLTPDGRLGIVDMSPPNGAEAFMNKIEKLRDSSHVWAHSPRSWESMLDKAGFELSSELIQAEHLSIVDWLYPVEGGGREAKAVRNAWRSASERVRTLLKADFRDGAVRGWTKRRIIIVASAKTP